MSGKLGGMRKTSVSGFTLIELMVTIAIAAILALVAIPSMRSLIERNAVTGQIGDLMGAIALARAEAIKRNAPVVLCRSTDAETSAAPTCAGSGDWKSGWVVFLDRNDNGSYSATDGDVILGVRGSFPKSGGITQNSYGKLIFRNTGLLRSGNSHFTLKSVSEDTSQTRCVYVSKTGRARVTDNTGGSCP